MILPTRFRNKKTSTSGLLPVKIEIKFALSFPQWNFLDRRDQKFATGNGNDPKNARNLAVKIV